MRLKRGSKFLLSVCLGFAAVLLCIWVYVYLKATIISHITVPLAKIDRYLNEGDTGKAGRYVMRTSLVTSQNGDWLSLLKRAYRMGELTLDYQLYYNLSEKAINDLPGYLPLIENYAHSLLAQKRFNELYALYKENPDPQIISVVVEATLIDFQEQEKKDYLAYFLETDLSPEIYARVALEYNDRDFLKNAFILFLSQNSFKRAYSFLEESRLDDPFLYFLANLALNNFSEAENYLKIFIEERERILLFRASDNLTLAELLFQQAEYEEALDILLKIEDQTEDKDVESLVKIINNRLMIQELLITPEQFIKELKNTFIRYQSQDFMLIFIDNYSKYLQNELKNYMQTEDTKNWPAELFLSFYSNLSDISLSESDLWSQLNKDHYNLHTLMFLTEYFLSRYRDEDARILLSRVQNILSQKDSRLYKKERSWYFLLKKIKRALEIRIAVINGKLDGQLAYQALYDDITEASMNPNWLSYYTNALLIMPLDEYSLARASLENGLTTIPSYLIPFIIENDSLGKYYIFLGQMALSEGRESVAKKYLEESFKYLPYDINSHFYHNFLPPPVPIKPFLN